MANNSSDELNTLGVLGSPRHIPGDKSTIAPAAPPTERAACLQFGGVHAQRPEGNIPSQLIELGLVDEYRFVVQPIVAGEGRRLLEDVRLPEELQLKLVDSKFFKSGSVALRYLKQ